MHVISAENVNDAYVQGMRYLSEYGEPATSRDGDVLVAPGPVTTVYERPFERVLFDPNRDANPFFHLVEAIWMLAGRRDATFLDRYVKNFSSRFAEEDGDCHGAYGHRWRHHFCEVDRVTPRVVEIDQIKKIGEMLYRDPTSRRCVLEMWDAETDLDVQKKDLPCNTHVYFRVHPEQSTLDITVCNRSNDIIMGAYGANAVHMSMMQEVVAGLAGVHVGTYYQVSNNYHAYRRDFDKFVERGVTEPYMYRHILSRPIVPDFGKTIRRQQARMFLEDCVAFCDHIDDLSDVTWCKTHWMLDVVVPLARTHQYWSSGDRVSAMIECAKIQADDWRFVCLHWMQRRIK